MTDSVMPMFNGTKNGKEENKRYKNKETNKRKEKKQ